jgi:uncharacterized membrane protein
MRTFQEEYVSLDWKAFAALSAVFAALTAIFGKLGVSEINSNLATFLRTLVVLALSALLVSAREALHRRLRERKIKWMKEKNSL